MPLHCGISLGHLHKLAESSTLALQSFARDAIWKIYSLVNTKYSSNTRYLQRLARLWPLAFVLIPTFSSWSATWSIIERLYTHGDSILLFRIPTSTLRRPQQVTLDSLNDTRLKREEGWPYSKQVTLQSSNDTRLKREGGWRPHKRCKRAKGRHSCGREASYSITGSHSWIHTISSSFMSVNKSCTTVNNLCYGEFERHVMTPWRIPFISLGTYSQSVALPVECF